MSEKYYGERDEDGFEERYIYTEEGDSVWTNYKNSRDEWWIAQIKNTGKIVYYKNHLGWSWESSYKDSEDLSNEFLFESLSKINLGQLKLS